MDFKDTKYYVNRELSWISFNERVLEEALDKSNPLLERFKFLAITGSNLDEFFMVRVSGLFDQIESGYTKKDVSGLTPQEQVREISKRVHQMVIRQNNCLMRSLLPQMEKKGAYFLKYSRLNREQKQYVNDYFNSVLFPILTPMAIDQSRPVPLLPNKSLSLITKVIRDGEKKYAVIQVPTVVDRILELPKDANGRYFIMLEDVIKEHVHRLFEGCEIRETSYFRLTRNSDLDIDEEDTEDLMEEIEESIKRRKWGAPVRLEIEKNMDGDLRKYLREILELEEEDIYEVAGYLDVNVWMKFSGLKGFDDLRFAPVSPQSVPAFVNGEDMFSVIKSRDILVHHPYESFDCVVRYIQAAARDPKVLAIKQTLYRVSGNSPVVAALIQAAENGKQVTVLVELKARFDEENNINWARKLEKAGCHVVYGLVGLKTHCKLCLVVRREEDGIRRYVHMATGNYNDSTAKLYTDFGFFTARETFGMDVSALFNVLTGYSQPPRWKKIAVAPTSLRETFLQWIESESAIAAQGREGIIVAKMNSLVDQGIIEALYRASASGVKIYLIVRGICCLKPGLAGVSDNIRVMSIVGRFLEHSRIFYFGNDGSSKIYLSSADWMPRNLDRRIEVAFPVEQEDLKERIMEMLRTTLCDTVKARVELSDGSYERIDRRGKESVHSQMVFQQMAVEAYENAKRESEEILFRPIEKLKDKEK